MDADQCGARLYSALVVEDMAAARAWLSEALQVAFPDIQVFDAENLAQARQRVAAGCPPDVVVVDLGLPDGNGVTLISDLKARWPATLCVVATVFDDDEHLFGALRAGADGYLLKDESHDDLVEQLRGIHQGRPPLSHAVARRVLAHFHRPVAAKTSAPLSPRETEVLVLISKGHTIDRVAGALEVSRHTIGGYLKDIYRKLNVSTRAGAALEAARRGLISLD